MITTASMRTGCLACEQSDPIYLVEDGGVTERHFVT